MKVYYAHCMAIYGTPQEQRDIATITALGHVVINPNTPDIEKTVTQIRAEVDEFNRTAIAATRNAGNEIMARVFLPLVEACDALAFRALPDGRIPAGVAYEICVAIEISRPVFELPHNLLGRRMTIQETKNYLAEVGQR